MHVRPKKRFGQHFLKEDDIALRITAALSGHGGYRSLIEVGPGTGALTRHLIARTEFDLTCVELERDAAGHLRGAFPGLRLVEADFLELDVDLITLDRFAVIGNFPYNISSQIVFKVLEHRDRCTEMVGMFQKEVADRLAAPHGSRTYGITSVLAQAFYDIELLFNVEPASFIPPPRVRSAVIRMARNETVKLACDEALFFTVVKTAFNQRRKTLHNALRSFPRLAGRVPEAFSGKRAEQLSVADFISLTQACLS